jgi:hypothetical protein
MPELPQNFLDHSNWTEFYPDAAEINELPSKMPQPLGNPVRVTCFVDADHAGDRATRRSYTGIPFSARPKDKDMPPPPSQTA